MKANTMLVFLCVVLFLCLTCNTALAQQPTKDSAQINPCSQNKTLRSQFIQEAEAKPYRVQRIEITGNVFVRDRTIREVMVFNEGDIFTGELLKESLKNIGKIKEMQPVTLKNVKILLDKKDAAVYLIFCVTERKRN